MTATAPLFDRRMLEALVCPVTQAVLAYDADGQELISKSANLALSRMSLSSMATGENC